MLINSLKKIDILSFLMICLNLKKNFRKSSGKCIEYSSMFQIVFLLQSKKGTGSPKTCHLLRTNKHFFFLLLFNICIWFDFFTMVYLSFFSWPDFLVDQKLANSTRRVFFSHFITFSILFVSIMKTYLFFRFWLVTWF